MTPQQIREAGMKALSRELGIVGMIRFMQQFETGRGDYSRDRHKFLPKMNVEEIGRQIHKGREANPKK
jgi:hypothetical protein